MKLRSLIVLFTLFVSSAAIAEVNIDDKVSVTRSGLVYNRATNTFDTTLAIKNISSQALDVPLAIVAANLSAPSVQLYGIEGYTSGGMPFVTAFPSKYLDPNETIRDIVLRFKNPNKVSFTFQVAVYNQLTEEQYGVLLPGTPSAPAVSATYDLPGIGVPETEIDTTTAIRIPRTGIEILFADNTTTAQINALVSSVNGKIVGMTEGVPIISVRIPDPGDLNSLAAILSAIRANPVVIEAVALPFPENNILPPSHSSGNPIGSSKWNWIDHHLSVKAHAAWNAKLAMTLVSYPWVIVADNFGHGALSYPPSSDYGLASINPGDFGVTDPPDPRNGFPLGTGFHGHEVLSIIAASFGDTTGNVGGDVTGIFPANSFLRVVERLPKIHAGLLRYPRQDEVERSIANLIKRLTTNFSRKVVVNTSFGFQHGNTPSTCLIPTDTDFPTCLEREFQSYGILWRTEVNGIKSKFVHTTSAGNGGGSALSQQFEAPYNSTFAAAALLPSTPPSLPPLDNTLVVEALMNTELATIPFRPNCLSDYSSSLGNISAIGTRVRLLDPTGTHPYDLSGVPVSNGTSYASPQVAGLATYMWAIRPSLNSSDIVSRIKSTATLVPLSTVEPPPSGESCSPKTAQPVIDAYAAVLSVDDFNMRVRKAILDVDNPNPSAPTFNADDIKAFMDAFASANGAIDYSRYDLNGDGRTGGDTTDRFDLDNNNPANWTSAEQDIEGKRVIYEEDNLTDQDILCYYAYSALYQGDTSQRSTLLKDKCGYDLELMAVSGAAGLTSIDNYVGINDRGTIAFTGGGPQGSQGFVTSSPGTYNGITYFGSTRSFLGASINSAPLAEAVFRVLITGPLTLIRKWTEDGASSTKVGYSADGDFRSGFQYVDINDNGVVSFTALKNDGVTLGLFAGASSPPALLANISAVSPPPIVRPQISNTTDDIVYRDNSGKIVINHYPSGSPQLMSGAHNSPGQAPGISPDGTVITFLVDNLPDHNVYVTVRDPNNGTPLLTTSMVGSSDGFDAFSTTERVGVVAKGDPLTQQDITVVFAATRNGKSGIYSADAKVVNETHLYLRRITTIIEDGDSVSGKVFSSGRLWDPIGWDSANKVERIAIRASFTDGTTGIIRATRR